MPHDALNILIDSLESSGYERYQEDFNYPQEWIDEADKIDKWISDNEVRLYKWMYDLILDNKSEILKLGE